MREKRKTRFLGKMLNLSHVAVHYQKGANVRKLFGGWSWTPKEISMAKSSPFHLCGSLQAAIYGQRLDVYLFYTAIDSGILASTVNFPGHKVQCAVLE